MNAVFVMATLQSLLANGALTVGHVHALAVIHDSLQQHVLLQDTKPNLALAVLWKLFPHTYVAPAAGQAALAELENCGAAARIRTCLQQALEEQHLHHSVA